MTEPSAGMDSGSDAGAPGDHLPDAPLDPDDRALLSQLLADDDANDTATATSAAGDGEGEDADTRAVEEAAEDDSPLPTGDGGSGRPGADDVVFRAPGDENRR